MRGDSPGNPVPQPDRDYHEPIAAGPDGAVSIDGPMIWRPIGTLDDIPRSGCRVVETREADIAVFRTGDDRVFAMHDRCPHRNGKLSQGIVHGTSVTCPLHGWVIGLDDGKAKDPDAGCVRTVPLKRDGHAVMLGMPS